MKFITADRIHDGQGWLPAGTTIVVTDDGTIVSFEATPTPDTVVYQGVLVPGFVNAHCHLELSHMKGLAAERTGLIPFLKNIPQYRDTFTDEQKHDARHTAFAAMLAAGVVAVGDIANTNDTLDLRATGLMHFHTFVESLGFTASLADRSFGFATRVYDGFAAQQPAGMVLRQSIVPHAPYSVSPALFGLIDSHQPGALVSIHNQESEDENRFYIDGSGGVPELLQVLGVDTSEFKPTGMRSLASYMQWMTHHHPLILVHNTNSAQEDVARAQANGREVYWCLCPNANLYIEGRLPDIDLFVREGVNICIGTDSLASNHNLSILNELVTIKQQYPQISWETLIGWGTMGGANALQMQTIVGSLTPGKKPGINLLQGLDQGTDSITVQRIV